MMKSMIFMYWVKRCSLVVLMGMCVSRAKKGTVMGKGINRIDEICIREAQSDDTTAMLSISSVLGYSPISLEEMQNSLISMQSSSSDKIWVAVLQSQNLKHPVDPKKQYNVVGWIHAFHAKRLASPSLVEIGGLAVSEDQQGHGVGRALVETAHQWAELLNCNIRVRCNETRVDTHNFYQALGFQTNKAQKVFQHN